MRHMPSSLRSSGFARGLSLAPARAYSRVGFYRQAALPELPLTVDEDDARWLKLRERTKQLLAPHPMGLSHTTFLDRLRRDFGIRPGKGLDEEGHVMRALARRMPDVAYAASGADARKVSRKLVYPAFFGNLKRGRRVAADYDTSTVVGAAAFRQFSDAVTMMLDVNPKGLRRDTFCNMLRHNYSHDVDFKLAQSLVERIPDVATWKVSDEYREYDAVRRARAPPPPPRPSSLRSRRKAWTESVTARFLQWYDDPPSEPRLLTSAKDRPETGGTA